MHKNELVLAAVEAARQAYAPYSHFHVGAALLGKSGRVYPGFNIENASYSATNCAERTALFSALAQGEKAFAMLAVAGGPEGKCRTVCPPCGVCRQVLREFCPPDFPVLLGKEDGSFQEVTLGELLPGAFSSSCF